MTLTVTDLSVGRGGLRILSGLSFTLAPGQALILQGPNGAGKTTLLRTLAGLTPPMGGDVQIDPDQIAYAAHADGLKAQLSVAENLTFWAQSFGQTDIPGALEHYDLARLATRRVAELSAGQKRRAGLARMLVMKRRIWLMDEPTVSLDADNTARFASAVQDHLAMGGIALLATHIELGLEAPRLDISAHAAGPEMRAEDDPFAWGEA